MQLTAFWRLTCLVQSAIFLGRANGGPKERDRIMENIGLAFLAISDMAHEWAEDFAGERGRDYDTVMECHGANNRFYREALTEMQWQAGESDREPVPADFEIEF